MKTMPSLSAVLCALLFFTVSAKAATTVNFGTLSQIAGPGDLDLSGEMTHAINFSPNDPALYVNGVKFTPDTALVPGLTVGPNAAAPWQTKPGFGTGVDNDNLEEIYQDIRWSNNTNGQTLQAHLPVTAGETYKVQILFYGNHANDDRRWDIEIEGAMGVDDVSSLGASTGPAPGNLPVYSGTAGLVYVHTLQVTDGTLDIRMGALGGVTDGGDRNALWQGLIVEHVVPDADSDGLPDAWEMATFGGTGAQAGSGDADSDGVTNQYEYQIGSNLQVSDSDGDGLLDDEEYFLSRTSLILADTDGDTVNDGLEDSDGDGLSNAAEIHTHHTHPGDTDSDDDDYTDGLEVTLGTNPGNNTSFPLYSTQMISFSGGDSGEGLDFNGVFRAAARFGVTTLSGSWAVRDATFVPYHSVPGLTQDAPSQVDAWTTMTFPGPLTPNDTNLAAVMRSIRYRGGSFNISLSGLTAGRSYKLQLLFAEQCCPTRGFDVYVEDALVADEFSPPAVQGGASASPARGAAVVYGFQAADTVLNIRLDKATVTTPSLSDPNPILNAFSLEEIPVAVDLDGDGLPDSWEVTYFGNTTAQSGNGDPDADGLSNSQELTSGTNPNSADTDSDGLADKAEMDVHGTNPRVPDTDSDGLSDGAEVNTHATNPNSIDTDRDTLTDGAEVTTHSTSPLSIDSDSDGYNDPTEILNNTSPASAASKPGDTHVARVLGPDTAEGLDLFGNFLYAFNVGLPGAAGQIHDANFTADAWPGVSLIAPNEVTPWFNPDFGSSPAEDALEFVYQSIRWADVAVPDPNNRITVDLAGLTPGRQYKLQMMFVESCCPFRYFDVSVNGSLLADEFNPAATQGSTASNIAGAAIIHTFTANGTSVNIRLDGTTTVAGTDHNATLSGITLEELVNVIPLDVTRVTRVPGGIKLDVRGTSGHAYSVDWSPDLAAWVEVNDFLVPNVNGDASWTDMNVTRVGPGVPRGFYKLRDPAVDPIP